MTNPFEQPGNQPQQNKPEWPAFPGASEPQQAPEPQPQSQPQPQAQPYQQTPPPPPPPSQGQPAFQQQPFQQQPFQQSQQQFQPQFAQQQYPQQMVQEPKKTNILGIIALGLAILGTILACIKAVMAVGWIALPIAFIMGIVALFMKNQGKAAAISAIAIAVVGSMIAGVMAFVYFLKDIDDEITGGETVVSGGNSGGSPKGLVGGKDEKGTSRENPLPLGSTIENNDWEVTVNSVEFKADAKIKAENPYNDDAKPGNEQILVNLTYKYKGNKPEGEYLFPVVDFVTPSGNSISWTDTFLMAPDRIDSSKVMYNGATVTGNVPFEVPAADAQNGVLAVTPGFVGNKRFFEMK